jgi:hypothetical protein
MRTKLFTQGRLCIAVTVIGGLLTSFATAAERAPSEEERIAPLVTKQNCWGGVIKYVLQERHFEVDEALCADGGLYYLEFDQDLRLTAKRFVRKGGERQP